MIFDTHAHYDDAAFAEDREALLSSLPGRGIGRVINVCSDMDSLRTTMELAEKYPYIYGAVGIHPDEVGNAERRDSGGDAPAVPSGKGGGGWERSAWIITGIRKIIRYRSGGSSGSLSWPGRRGPFRSSFTAREAAADTLEVMKRMKAGEIGGVMHCFSYSRELAREYLDMGLYLGIGGVLTFKNARKLKEVVEYAASVPAFAGTDCPLSGARSQPGKTEFIAESAVCGGGDCRSEGCFPRRSDGKDGGKCVPSVQKDFSVTGCIGEKIKSTISEKERLKRSMKQ